MILKDFIETFFPYVKMTLKGAKLIPPVLSFTLIELFELLELKKCELVDSLERKQFAGKSTCEEDIYIITEAEWILNDPLTPTSCAADTLNMLNLRYDLLSLNVQGRDESVVNIGDWDMNSNKTVTVAHGLTNPNSIVSINVIIRDDNGVQTDAYFYTKEKGIWTGTDATNITLDVTGITKFDGADYNLTPFNRGYVSIVYNT